MSAHAGSLQDAFHTHTKGVQTGSNLLHERRSKETKRGECKEVSPTHDGQEERNVAKKRLNDWGHERRSALFA